MFQQTIWAAFRNLCQIYAISVGGAFGVMLITTTQVINILGSGGGYQLAANNYVAALVDAEHRTGSFGVMSGFTMLGAALGFVRKSNYLQEFRTSLMG
jgi:fucose permease